MVSLVICLEGRERHAVAGDRAKPNRLQRTDLQSRRPSSSVQDTDSKPAVAFPTAAMMTEQTNKLRAKPEMTIAKLEILTANPEITDANLEKNFTATEMTMTARVMVSVIRTMVSVIRTMVGTEHAGVATLAHHTSTVTAGERELDHFIEKLPSASGFAHIENIDQELASNVEKMHSFNVLY